jgi:hypothetical protein
MNQELANFVAAHLSRVTLLVKQDESPNPARLCLLRARTVMSQDRSSKLIQ